MDNSVTHWCVCLIQPGVTSLKPEKEIKHSFNFNAIIYMHAGSTGVSWMAQSATDRDPAEEKIVTRNIYTRGPMVFIMDPKVSWLVA